MKKIKLLILDIDGVMTDGTKEYDKDHNVLSKKFLCKDFTAIKRFSAAGIKVVLLSGDSWNRTMAEKRQLPFFCTRDENLSLDKSIYIDKFESMFGIDRDEMAFVGDAPDIIKNNAKGVLQTKGGEGVIVDLYDWFIGQNYITQEASMKEVLELDKQELTSVEMK